jgi:plastocyanin
VRHIRTILVLLAAGALLAAGCASDDGGQEAAEAPAATAAPGTTASGGGATGGDGRGGVRIAGFAFAPKTVSARVGQKVTWENQDPSTIHTVTALDGSFRSGQLKQGGEFARLPAGRHLRLPLLHPPQHAGHGEGRRITEHCRNRDPAETDRGCARDGADRVS